jgi:hypothetical protein
MLLLAREEHARVYVQGHRRGQGADAHIPFVRNPRTCPFTHPAQRGPKYLRPGAVYQFAPRFGAHPRRIAYGGLPKYLRRGAVWQFAVWFGALPGRIAYGGLPKYLGHGAVWQFAVWFGALPGRIAVSGGGIRVISVGGIRAPREDERATSSDVPAARSEPPNVPGFRTFGGAASAS